MVTAIVLAAGLSERMGRNKLLLEYSGKTVIEMTIGNIMEGGIDEVVVVTGHEADQLRSALNIPGVRFVHNVDYRRGMTSSIQCGIREVKGSGLMICLGDMFLVNGNEYALLKQAYEQNVSAKPALICLPRYQGAKGNPVIFAPYYKQVILQHTDPDGCKNIIREFQENITWVEMPTGHILQDLDYEEDYSNLLGS